MRESQVPRPRESVEDSIFPKPKLGGLDQRRALAGGHGGVPRSPPGAPWPSASDPPIGRIDLSRLTTAPPLHRPTVTGGGAGRPARHVGGGAQPPANNAIGLSDGTRISFAAVEEIPVLEYA
jgi:hypothetical protein